MEVKYLMRNGWILVFLNIYYIDAKIIYLVKYLTLNTVGYAKCEISLMVLSELGLIQKDGAGFYKITGAGRRTELANSAVYRNLLERSGKQ